MSNQQTVRNYRRTGQSIALTYSIAAVLGFGVAAAQAQTNNFFGAAGTLSGNVWSTNPAGPYTSALDVTGGATINFGNVATFTGASITVAGINATANATGTPGGTISNLSNGVIPISVSLGVTLDFGTQAFTSAAGAGYVKNGDGVLALAGNTYGGGFTLNAGTVIARGINALGGAATNSLTLNGGILASNATRDLTGKYTNGITVGGNVQFGDTVGLASSSANLTFSNNMALGGATRMLTLGNGGNVAFGGVISNTGGVGITFAATAGGTGRFDVTNAANLYTGTTTITGGEVRFTADQSLGPAPGSVTPGAIVIDGGRFATVNGGTYTLSANRGIQVGAAAGTGISTPGAGVLTYDGIIADKPATTGAWAKQGGGTLALGGVSTYTGGTAINNGIVQLTTGNDRLPTGTTVSLGQAASANLGTLDLNTRSQTIAGLNSTPGTSVAATNNTVTSAGAATLTLGGSETYSYGDGTAANSGVITGAIALVKSGAGTQVLGDDNTFTGSTTITGGTLTAAAAQTGHQALGGTSGISVTNGTLLLGASNQIQKTSNLTLDTGATFDLAGFSEVDAGALSDTTNGLGSLILANTATLDFGTLGDGTSILQFGGLGTHTAGMLQLKDFDSGVDRLLFSGVTTDFTTKFPSPAEVSFNGAPGYNAIQFGGYFEIVPVPEPATILGALGLLGFVGFRERRRVTNLFTRFAGASSRA
ncbi:MAG: autotransporter-associated beta strand repeat-containing protein [Chthoniobacteraceae bacterium]